MGKAAESAAGTGPRGSYRTGDETRRRLVETALLRFSRDGYEGTSTRDICGEAGVTLPAIAYHFGSKEGLYLACADHVVARYRTRMGESLAAMAQAIPAMAPAAARAALKQVVGMLLDVIADAGDSEPWLAFMLHEMSRRGAAHARMMQELWLPGLGLVAALIAAVRQAPADADDRVDALLLLSSLSAVTTARRVATTFNDWSAIDAETGEQIAARLERWIDRL